MGVSAGDLSHCPTARKDGRAAYPRLSIAIGTKAKGRFLLRDLALVPIFGDPGQLPDHNSCIPESPSSHEPKPRFPRSSTTHSPQKLFHYPQSPVAFASLVADSLRWRLVRSLLWKITLSLKAILLSTNGNANGSDNFYCGNGVTKMEICANRVCRLVWGAQVLPTS